MFIDISIAVLKHCKWTAGPTSHSLHTRQ